MAGYLEAARRGAFQVVGWQFLAAVLAGVLGALVGGPKTGEWAFLGGMIATLASLVMAWRVFGGRLERDPKRMLGRMVLGEAFKFTVTALLFGVAIVKMRAAFLPLMLGYLAAFAAYWIGYLRGSFGQAR
ncbi:MAG TPA: ATP synthase subunit I [Gammaproteobacteria bacterium]|jgi:F0F1-type ATP synthase assembly protein I|nr:ATP synthase subunit I [Gammaproteobacteria bacterium]